METIKQRGENDCYICCLAMAAGLTYEQLEKKLGAALTAGIQIKGTYGKDTEEVFARLGMAKDRDYAVRYLNLHNATTGFTRNLLWGRRAMVQVKSRNVQDGEHIVYWDGWTLHDPTTKSAYDKWEEVEPTYIWLFNESPSVTNGVEARAEVSAPR